MEVLKTPRLSLRWLRTDDAPFILTLLNEPAFHRFIGDRGVRNLGDARSYITDGPLESCQRLGFGLYLVELQQGQVPLGLCGLIKRDVLQDVDIGYAFLQRYWSQGYAFEAASAVLAYARETLGLERLAAVVNPDNERSIRLLEKLGMEYAGPVRLAADAPQISLYTVVLQPPASTRAP